MSYKFMTGRRIVLVSRHTAWGRFYDSEAKVGATGVITNIVDPSHSEHPHNHYQVRWDHNEARTSCVDESCIEVELTPPTQDEVKATLASIHEALKETQ